MRKVFILIAITIPGLIFSQKITGEQYIETYKLLAIKEMKRTGIPASITLAQGMLESGNGNSKLAVKGNNHFGIKCHNTWKGPKIHHDDDRRGECFRKYKSAYESYIDHSNFLTTTSRYNSLFELSPTNYKAWAKGLKKAGYATARDYDTKLISLIERYDLYKYDSEKGIDSNDEAPFISAKKGHSVRLNNNIKYIVIESGDTYYSITREFEMMEWQLAKYNNITTESILKTGEILYLQPKRKKAARGNNYHIVSDGETMNSISQKYGVKLNRLYQINQIKKDDILAEGDKIHLRSAKKEKNQSRNIKTKKTKEPETNSKEKEEEKPLKNSKDLEFIFE